MKKNISLIILDGYGLSESVKGNAVKLAKTPFLNKLFNEYPNNTLMASGSSVGLPEGQMGNSEVGHLNFCLLYTSPSPRDRTRSRMPSSA